VNSPYQLIQFFREWNNSY